MESVAGEEGRSEDLTVSVGEKRVAVSDGDVEEARSVKKAKNGGELSGNLKRVAEIVLVLETMGKIRGGRSPSQAEIDMMCEAREKLVEVCQEFAPKDVFPGDAFGLVIDDLGLSKISEQRLGFSPPDVSIVEKLKLTQEKMEKSEEFSLHTASYTSQRGKSSVAAAAESGTTHAIRLQPASPLARVATANSTSLPYQLPTSEVRPVVSNASPGSHVGIDSSSALPRAERPHFRFDMKPNAAYTSQIQDNSPGIINPLTWSVQTPQSTLSVKNMSDSNVLVNASVKVEGAAETPRTHTLESIISRSASVNPPSNQQGMVPVQTVSLSSKHIDIANIVQKLLQPKVREHSIWTPPSRDYMNKSLTCQLCKLITNELESVLVCDGCEKGYHLKCLKIHTQKSVPRGEWHCGKCLSLSNGKALPPKYGRVLRNMTTAPKMSSNTTTVQIPSEKTLGPLSGKVTEDGKFGIQNASSGIMHNKFEHTAAGVEMTDKRVMHKEIHENSSGCDPIDMVKTSADPSNASVGLSVDTSEGNKLIVLADSWKEKNAPNISKNPSTNCPDTNSRVKDLQKTGSETNNGAKQFEQGTLHAHHGEIFGISSRCKEQDGSLPDGLHEVDWIGDILNVVGEKTYYQSCSINGVVYKVHDHALFCMTSNILTPFKLQRMWEDSKSRSKWVIASQCYYPTDLPKAVGRPFAPDNSEVYESNHDSAMRAGLIQGPCKVLPPRLYIKESQMRSHLGMESTGAPQPLFVCKWFFDIQKGSFRDVAS